MSPFSSSAKRPACHGWAAPERWQRVVDRGAVEIQRLGHHLGARTRSDLLDGADPNLLQSVVIQPTTVVLSHNSRLPRFAAEVLLYLRAA